MMKKLDDDIINKTCGDCAWCEVVPVNNDMEEERVCRRLMWGGVFGNKVIGQISGGNDACPEFVDKQKDKWI